MTVVTDQIVDDGGYRSHKLGRLNEEKSVDECSLSVASDCSRRRQSRAANLARTLSRLVILLLAT